MGFRRWEILGLWRVVFDVVFSEAWIRRFGLLGDLSTRRSYPTGAGGDDC